MAQAVMTTKFVKEEDYLYFLKYDITNRLQIWRAKRHTRPKHPNSQDIDRQNKLMKKEATKICKKQN